MARGVFLDDVPKVRIIDGLVHVKSSGTEYVMLPSVFRKYMETGRRVLDQWDKRPDVVVPLKKTPVKKAAVKKARAE
jgi:hypothetical protein